MERDGLVSRTPGLADRRRNFVRIEPAGRKLLRELDGLVDEAQERVLTRLSPDQRAQVCSPLLRVSS